MHRTWTLGGAASLAALAALPLSLSPQRAAAQSCSITCSPGYSCAVSSYLSCFSCAPPVGYDAGAGAPIPSRASGSTGTTASPDDGGVPLPPPYDAGSCEDAGCTTTEYSYCTPSACTSDADCPGTMACYTETWQECSGYACKPGLDCGSDAGVSCTERTSRTCRERYSLPCSADADCGEGFECNRSPYTSCSGGGTVTPLADGGYLFEDAGSSCETVTPETGSCNLQELPCQADAECPAGMNCQFFYQYPPCVFGPSVPTDPTSSPEKADGGVFYECPPPVQTQVCRPTGWGGGWTGADAGSDNGAGAGTGYPGSGDGSTAGSGGGGTTGGGTSGGGPTTPGADAGTKPPTSGHDGGADGHGHGHHHGRPVRSLLKHLFGSGGCSVASESAHGNLVWLGVLGLFLARRRRGLPIG